MNGETGKDQLEAALSAGYIRLRPVCMTALAMIIGMLPMALAFGEGGEQNAPLGRAVIGGLLFATIGTLFIVPIMYTLLRKQRRSITTSASTKNIKQSARNNNLDKPVKRKTNIRHSRRATGLSSSSSFLLQRP